MTAEEANFSDRLLVAEKQSEITGDALVKLTNSFEQFVHEIGEWRIALGRPNWPVIIGLVSAFIAAAGIFVVLLIASLSVFWFLINSQVGNVTSPLRQELTAVVTLQKTNTDLINQTLVPGVAALKAADAESVRDRTDMKDKDTAIQTQVYAGASNIRANTEKLKEIETQIHSANDSRNIQWASQQRENAMLQNALNSLNAPLPQYPVNPFYPTTVPNRPMGDPATQP